MPSPAIKPSAVGAMPLLRRERGPTATSVLRVHSPFGRWLARSARCQKARLRRMSRPFGGLAGGGEFGLHHQCRTKFTRHLASARCHRTIQGRRHGFHVVQRQRLEHHQCEQAEPVGHFDNRAWHTFAGDPDGKGQLPDALDGDSCCWWKSRRAFLGPSRRVITLHIEPCTQRVGFKDRS